jgi:protein-L-isoaspartate(D-aspartate) O-methyltransferase
MQQRAWLVDGIARSERVGERVTQAMRAVPRHAFVPEEQRERAYDDSPLPIGHGQTISQPTVVAVMTEALRLRGHETVLEVGTGSGYQAAVLSRLVRRVESIELLEPLAEAARASLTAAGYDNVRVHVGDGYQGLPQLAPFDAIIITAAPPEIPPKLVEQLKVGGRMVLPVGPRFGVQDLLVLEKQPDGSIERTNLGPVRFVPMVHGH